MRQSIAFVALLASTAVAETVVSWYFPGGYEFENAPPVATIESVNPSTTQMLLSCPTGVDSTDCGFGIDMDVKIISGTSYEVSVSYGSSSAGYHCQHNTQAAEMSCVGESPEQEPETTVLSGSEITFYPATVVKGAELLGTTASTTGSASASASASARSSVVANSASATSSGLKTSASTTASGSAAASGQTSGPAAASSKASQSGATSSGAAAPEHTGAAARLGMEGSAIIALAGVVALNLW